MVRMFDNFSFCTGLCFFALLIQKDRGNGPCDVLASCLYGVVLNPSLTEASDKDK